MPRSWYYSTEIRILNTELIASPLFFFTQNLALIKTITTMTTIAVLYLATLFLVSSFGIEKRWLILLCGLLIICPVSRLMWTYVHFGSFYIPHIAICFFYVGLFPRLSFADISPVRRRIFAGLFLFLAFCGGLGSIRYFLNFIFPLAAVVIGRKILLQYRATNELRARAIFEHDRETFWAGLGCAVCVLGYVVNTLVLANLYSVKNYNKIRFLPLGEATVTGVIDMILEVAGYNSNASYVAVLESVGVKLSLFDVEELILCSGLTRHTHHAFVGVAREAAGIVDELVVGGHIDDVALLQAYVAAGLTAEEGLVDVDPGYLLAATGHLNVAQRTYVVDTAGAVEGVEHGGEGAEAIGARSGGIAYDIDLNGAHLT